MKSKSERLISTLLAFALVLGLSAALPLTANSANAATLTIKQTTSVSVTQIAIQLELHQIAAGDSITIDGSKTNADGTLTLNIPNDKTVIWKADYSGNIDAPLINVTGSGIFQVAAGGSIKNSAGDAIDTNGSNTIVVSGGTASTTAVNRSAIYAATANCVIVVSSGTASASAEKGYGICVNDAGTTVNVQGAGTVSATGPNGAAIYTRGKTTAIYVSGSSTVSATGTGGKGILATAEKATVSLSGGKVSAVNTDAIHTIGTESKILVGGNADVFSNTGRAIYAQGANSIVVVDNGTVNSNSETAIWAPDAGSSVTIEGGMVSSGGAEPTIAAMRGKFIMSGGTVKNTGMNNAVSIFNAEISGGTISSKSRSAVFANNNNALIKISGGTLEYTGTESYFAVCTYGTGCTIDISGGIISSVGTSSTVRTTASGSTVKVTGGFVFGYGVGTVGVNYIIFMSSGSPTIGGTAVVCAWDKPSGSPAYTAGTWEDLTVNPSLATAEWGLSGTQTGISYAHGANSGFFPINGVTINPAVTEVAPTVTGPTTMTLTAGYAATSTGVYTIGGTPAPTVSKADGNAAITWNNATKKLDIAAGLAAGSYPVVLMAANGVIPDATLTFTLTVTASGGTTTPFPFTDVPVSAWYYSDVKIAWEQGLINGKTATLYAPDDNLNYAEAVKLAACMHQLHTTGTVTLANGSPNWYDSYVTYAKNNGIINKDYTWNAQATRAGYMEIFANALPASALAAINTVPDGSIPDVPMTHPQAAAIYKLYRAGIVQGVDAAHNCDPTSNIKRSEVAAILTRMMNETARIPFSM